MFDVVTSPEDIKPGMVFKTPHWNITITRIHDKHIWYTHEHVEGEFNIDINVFFERNSVQALLIEKPES